MTAFDLGPIQAGVLTFLARSTNRDDEEPMTDEVTEETITDLLADLMHFCREHKIPFIGALSNASHHFDVERKER